MSFLLITRQNLQMNHCRGSVSQPWRLLTRQLARFPDPKCHLLISWMFISLIFKIMSRIASMS